MRSGKPEASKQREYSLLPRARLKPENSCRKTVVLYAVGVFIENGGGGGSDLEAAERSSGK